MTVNQRVKYLRKEVLGLSQAEFGAALCLGTSSIGMMETRTGVTERNIAAISRLWGVREEWLRNGTRPIFKAGATPQNLSLDAKRVRIAEGYASLSPDKRALFWQMLDEAIS